MFRLKQQSSTRFVVNFLLIVILLADTSFAAGPPSQAVPVIVAQARQQQLAPTAWYAGNVLSRDDARLSAEISARLNWVAEVGTKFNKGEVLARLDNTFIRQQLIENQAAVSREQAKLELFSKEVKRLTRLAKQNNAAQRQLDQAVSDRAVALSELQVAQARVVQTQEQLTRAEFVAPFSGVVTERYKQAGEWVESGKEVLRIVDPNSVEIQTRIPVDSLSYVTVGQSMVVRAAEQTDIATVQSIVPVGDDRSRLYELRLQPKSQQWHAGQTVRVAVPNGAATQALVVPRDALVLRRSGVIVFRINQDNNAEMLTVRTGIASDGYIQVIGPLQAGDKVVTRGGERLRPGQTVQINELTAQP